MKNILLSVFGLIIFNAKTIQAWPDYFNAYELSSFEIKSQGAGTISVSFDHQMFPNQTKLFSISGVAPGNHYVEIFTERLVYHGYYATNERVKLYGGNVYIRPASLVKGAIDHLGRFYIKDIDPIVYPYQDPYYPYQPYDPYQNYHPAPMAMNDIDFRNFLKVVDDQWYDDTKLSVAMQGLRTNYFTSQQIAAVMDKFWYEDTKLEFAKAAYAAVIDKQNYFIVNKEFWYSSSVEELNEFLSHQ